LAETAWLARLRLAAGSGRLGRPGRSARHGVLPLVWRLVASMDTDRLLLLLLLLWLLLRLLLRLLIGLVGEEQPR